MSPGIRHCISRCQRSPSLHHISCGLPLALMLSERNLCPPCLLGSRPHSPAANLRLVSWGLPIRLSLSGTHQCLPCSLVPTSPPSLSCRQRSANRFHSPPWYPPSNPLAVRDTPCSFLHVSWGLRLTPLQPRIHQSLPDLLGSPLHSTVVRNPPISSTSFLSLSCRQRSINLHVCWALPLLSCCRRSTNLFQISLVFPSLRPAVVRDPSISSVFSLLRSPFSLLLSEIHQSPEGLLGSPSPAVRDPQITPMSSWVFPRFAVVRDPPTSSMSSQCPVHRNTFI